MPQCQHPVASKLKMQAYIVTAKVYQVLIVSVRIKPSV